MPHVQFDIKQKPKLFAHQGWTIAVTNPHVAQTYYLAHVAQVDEMRFVSLVGDYSVLLEQARMCSDIQFVAMTIDGDEVSGDGTLSILGRVKELNLESSGLANAVALLFDSQVFLSEDSVLVEFVIQSVQDLHLLSSVGLSLRT